MRPDSWAQLPWLMTTLTRTNEPSLVAEKKGSSRRLDVRNLFSCHVS